MKHIVKPITEGIINTLRKIYYPSRDFLLTTQLLKVAKRIAYVCIRRNIITDFLKHRLIDPKTQYLTNSILGFKASFNHYCDRRIGHSGPGLIFYLNNISLHRSWHVLKRVIILHSIIRRSKPKTSSWGQQSAPIKYDLIFQNFFHCLQANIGWWQNASLQRIYWF